MNVKADVLEEGQMGKEREAADEEWGSRIKGLREAAGLSQLRMAEIAGLTDRKTVAGWESNGILPGADAIRRLAEHFGVSTDFLLTGREHGSDAPSPEAEAWIRLQHVRRALTSSLSELERNYREGAAVHDEARGATGADSEDGPNTGGSRPPPEELPGA